MKKKWVVEMSQNVFWSAGESHDFSPLPYVIFAFQHDEEGLLIIFGWLFWQFYAWRKELKE